MEIDEKELHPKTQSGFRQGNNTMDNINILEHQINNELKIKYAKVCVFLVDQKAAFDNVNRKKRIQV